MGPCIPAWPIIFGSYLDIPGGLTALLGIDILQPSVNAGPYMYSDFVVIDWDHSMAMMLIWSSFFAWVVCH